MIGRINVLVAGFLLLLGCTQVLAGGSQGTPYNPKNVNISGGNIVGLTSLEAASAVVGTAAIARYDLVAGAGSAWYKSSLYADPTDLLFLMSAVQTTSGAARSAGFSVVRPFTLNLSTGRVTVPDLKVSALTVVNALIANATPTIAVGFGTGPYVISSNGTATFRISVGSGGTASTGTVGLPYSPGGWNCMVGNYTYTANQITVMTSSTATSAYVQNYTASTGALVAWPANATLIFNCMSF